MKVTHPWNKSLRAYELEKLSPIEFFTLKLGEEAGYAKYKFSYDDVDCPVMVNVIEDTETIVGLPDKRLGSHQIYSRLKQRVDSGLIYKACPSPDNVLSKLGQFQINRREAVTDILKFYLKHKDSIVDVVNTYFELKSYVSPQILVECLEKFRPNSQQSDCCIINVRTCC